MAESLLHFPLLPLQVDERCSNDTESGTRVDRSAASSSSAHTRFNRDWTKSRSARSSVADKPADARSRQAKALSTQRGPARTQMQTPPLASATQSDSQSSLVHESRSLQETRASQRTIQRVPSAAKKKKTTNPNRQARSRNVQLEKNGIILLLTHNRHHNPDRLPFRPKLSLHNATRSHHQTTTATSSIRQIPDSACAGTFSPCVKAVPLRDSLWLPSLQLP